MSDKPEIRYCKKCGCELTSTNKKKLCENCRRNKNGVVKNIYCNHKGQKWRIKEITNTRIDRTQQTAIRFLLSD